MKSWPRAGINPDECVAMGAALQGGVLGGEVKGLLLLDVTPLSLGVETMGGIMTKLIERNTTIPTKKSEIFSTASDNQPAVDVHVLQGEREMARDNKSIGRFKLDGIAPAPRGVPQIEVTFDIDANGILHVTAKDLGTGKEQKITITASSGLSDAEIERMVNEAKAHADDDKAAKDKIETKNHADSMVYQTEKQMKEFGDKIPADVKGQIESAIAKLKKELEQLLQKIGEAVYAAQQQAQQAGAAQGAADAGSRPDSNGGNDDGVVDAEVVDDK